MSLEEVTLLSKLELFRSKKKKALIICRKQSLGWTPRIYTAHLTYAGWGGGCTFSPGKSSPGGGCPVSLVLMAQEKVSPSGLHKYSMWWEEETASQEYLKKVKTVVKDELGSLHHRLQCCQLTSSAASRGKDCGIS